MVFTYPNGPTLAEVTLLCGISTHSGVLISSTVCIPCVLMHNEKILLICMKCLNFA